MSGRRSSSSEGNPGGIAGGGVVSGKGCWLNSAGRLADQDGDGVLECGAIDGHIDGLRARGFELRLRLRHIHAGCDAALVAAVGQLQRLLVGSRRSNPGAAAANRVRAIGSNRAPAPRADSVPYSPGRRRWPALPSARLRRCGARVPKRPAPRRRQSAAADNRRR